MTNKKASFLILTFAVVAALLTLYRNPGMMSRDSDGQNLMYTEGSIGSESMMGQAEPVMGLSGAVAPSMGMRVEDLPRKIAPATDSYMVPTRIPLPYYDDALSVEARVYDHSAYQGVVVSNVSEYMRQVKEYLQTNGGKVMHVSQYTNDDMQYAYIDARVPAEKFDEATGLFASRAKKVITESLNTQDVTGQQKSMSDQLVKLEEQKAAKATELSTAATEALRQKIQAEIDQINMQLESLKVSQIQFAENVKYATISLTVSDSERYFNPEKGASAGDEFQNALRSLKSTAKVLGIFLIWVGVYSALWLPIVLGARWLIGKMNTAANPKK